MYTSVLNQSKRGDFSITTGVNHGIIQFFLIKDNKISIIAKKFILKNSTDEETIIVESSTAKNALEDSRVLISKLEKDNDLLINEINSKKDTIKKLTSQIGN